MITCPTCHAMGPFFEWDSGTLHCERCGCVFGPQTPHDH